jgi:DNA-binding transcriptional ArsR family regulator
MPPISPHADLPLRGACRFSTFSEPVPRDIASLASGIATTEFSVSKDLTALRAAGLIEAQPVGRSLRYALCDPGITVACDLMRDLARRRLEHSRALEG